MKTCCKRLSSYLFSLSLRCGNNITYYHRGIKGQLLQCTSFVTVACAVVLCNYRLHATEPVLVPETKLLTFEGNFSALMVAGIDRFLTRATSDSILKRAKLWHRDFSSPEAYRRSVEPNRKRFRKIIGAIDERVSLVKLQYRAGPDIPIVISETETAIK